jgi:hemolysin activation/secretion protein
MVFRGLVTDQREMELKRFMARGNYIYGTAGIERNQKLPWKMGLYVKVDGQISDQPLISNEQYAAGGMKNVRGYKESEELGDDAFHGILELSGPDLSSLFSLGSQYRISPYLFYDYAELWLKDPLPGQDRRASLMGTGLGIRGLITRFVEYEVDWAVALEDTDRVEKWDQEFYFMVKGVF